MSSCTQRQLFVKHNARNRTMCLKICSNTGTHPAGKVLFIAAPALVSRESVYVPALLLRDFYSMSSKKSGNTPDIAKAFV